MPNYGPAAAHCANCDLEEVTNVCAYCDEHEVPVVKYNPAHYNSKTDSANRAIQ
jgi:hypothetical protein